MTTAMHTILFTLKPALFFSSLVVAIIVLNNITNVTLSHLRLKESANA